MSSLLMITLAFAIIALVLFCIMLTLLGLAAYKAYSLMTNFQSMYDEMMTLTPEEVKAMTKVDDDD